MGNGEKRRGRTPTMLDGPTTCFFFFLSRLRFSSLLFFVHGSCTRTDDSRRSTCISPYHPPNAVSAATGAEGRLVSFRFVSFRSLYLLPPCTRPRANPRLPAAAIVLDVFPVYCCEPPSAHSGQNQSRVGQLF